MVFALMRHSLDYCCYSLIRTIENILITELLKSLYCQAHETTVCDPSNIRGRKEMFYLTTHPTHFIYGCMASDKW